MEAQWYAERTRLRTLLRSEPTWSLQDLADATHRSLGWVKKWVKRLRSAPDDDDQVLHARSCAPKHPPPPLSSFVVERILDIRDHPPHHLQRTPGPKAILYYLAHDQELVGQQLRVPRSTRTVWQILRQHGRIAIHEQRQHKLVERPAPMTAWQLDFKDVSTVPADPDGKQQHVVEVLNTVDIGTSLLVNAQVRPDFTAETTIQSIIETLRTQGLPETVTLDRDPRFVGSQQQRDFPAPLLRMLYCLGVHVTICPPRRPDKNAFVERYNKTYADECLRVYTPRCLEAVETITAAFQRHYNDERPNQALTCHNQPPAVAFPQLAPRPPLPASLDPDRWVERLDGQRYVRKISRDGTVKVDNSRYYIDQGRAGSYVSLRIDAAQRAFVVEHREQPIKTVAMKGLIGERLALDTYLEQITLEARTHLVAGRAIGLQLRLL